MKESIKIAERLRDYVFIIRELTKSEKAVGPLIRAYSVSMDMIYKELQDLNDELKQEPSDG